jgi:Domain of unknown function (DUF4118)
VVVGVSSMGDRWTGLFVGVVAGASFNFFHTLPYHSLNIANRRDVVTVALLSVVGIFTGHLATIRMNNANQIHGQTSELRRLQKTVALVAAEAPVDEVWQSVREALVTDLHLDEVRFQAGPVHSVLPELGARGSVSHLPMLLDQGGFVLPAAGIALPVQLGSHFFGPDGTTGTHLSQRQNAIALAQQLAIALAREPHVPAFS